MIQEWDEQRGIRRVSKWAEFGIDDKRRFLADLAYVLTRREVFRFDEKTLVEVYEDLADRYELPKSQGRQVAQELESHTGLLMEVGERQFEFSHAALQEYLAADAMVRGSIAVLDRWWTTFPALSAVTVAMSSDPNRWLHDLVAKIPANLDDVGPLAAFLDRLGQERPRFERSRGLGNDLLLMAWRAHLPEASAVERLGRMKSVRDSVADALRSFTSLEIGSATTRAARYEEGSSAPSAVLGVPTSVAVAMVGADRLRQIAREIEKERLGR